MLYSLQELGWQYVGPTLFLNNHGEEVKLTAGEPRRLQQLMERTLEEQHEAAVVQALHRRKGVTESELKQVDEYGIDFEAVRKAVNSKKTSRRGHTLSPHGQRARILLVLDSNKLESTLTYCALCVKMGRTQSSTVYGIALGWQRRAANTYQKEPWDGAEQVGSTRF